MGEVTTEQQGSKKAGGQAVKDAVSSLLPPTSPPPASCLLCTPPFAFTSAVAPNAVAECLLLGRLERGRERKGGRASHASSANTKQLRRRRQRQKAEYTTSGRREAKRGERSAGRRPPLQPAWPPPPRPPAWLACPQQNGRRGESAEATTTRPTNRQWQGVEREREKERGRRGGACSENARSMFQRLSVILWPSLLKVEKFSFYKL